MSVLLLYNQGGPSSLTVKLYNLARMLTNTQGQGTVSFTAAAPGSLTFAAAGATNGDSIRYAIEDAYDPVTGIPQAREIGTGTYNAGTLTRSVINSTNGNNLLNLTGGAQVFITAAAADFQSQIQAPSALTETDDTNVTLTLGGSPSTALVAAVSITVGWTGTLALSRLAQGSAGQIIVGQTSAAPSYETVSGDATLAATGALTLATVNSGSGSVGSSTAIPVLTTNAKGLVTAQTTAVVIAPAGTLSGTTLASQVVTSSLTSVGALASGSPASAFTAVSGPLGGTGLTTAAIGDIIYASATTPTWSRLADVAVGQVLVSGGVTTAPAYSATPALTSLALGGATIGSNKLAVTGTSLFTGAMTGTTSLSLGVQQTGQGSLVLANTAAGAYATTIKSSNSATAAVTYVLPVAVAGAAGDVLTDAAGDGVLSWAAASVGSGALTIGTTAITSGTGTHLLYETSGNKVGEISGATSNGTVLTLVAPVLGAATGTSLALGGATLSTNALAVNGTIAGTGFSSYLASPPAIGGTAPNQGIFSSLGVLTTGATLSTALLAEFGNGSSGSPIASLTPSVTITRYEAVNTVDATPINAAVVIWDYANNTSTPSINAYANGLSVFAIQSGSGDVQGINGEAFQYGAPIDSTHNTHAFGVFAYADVSGTNDPTHHNAAIALNSYVTNSQGVDCPAGVGGGNLGSGSTCWTAAQLVQGGGAHLNSVGVFLYAASPSQFDIGFYVGPTAVHTYAFMSNGFNVTEAGVVTGTNYYAGAAAGVNCASGTINATTVVITGGIVTHC